MDKERKQTIVYVAPEIMADLVNEYNETVEEMKFIRRELLWRKCTRCKERKNLERDLQTLNNVLDELIALIVTF